MDNSMFMLVAAIAIMSMGGVFSMMAWKNYRIASLLGGGSLVAGCVVGIIPAFKYLICPVAVEWRAPWMIPGGELYLAMDSLTAFFLIPVFILSGLAAIYGVEYLKPFKTKKTIGFSWFCFNILVASMIIVMLARNGVLFLLAWETMALSSFFLVAFEDDKTKVQEAGWIYLIAAHLGTAFLLAMFLVMESVAGSFNFDQFASVAAVSSAGGTMIFILAAIGFGSKAGFMPLHVWLPEAHPAAPSHVSALMSGVMIKTGIYGLIRIILLFNTLPAWWGWTLVAIGVISGVLGVLFALAQHDIKRLLAYHSVENIGIITLGLGLGMIGLSYQNPALAVLGFGGGLLHVLNHAIFKGLLFMGSGAVAHATGTRDVDHMGGLLKKMPLTAVTFLVGSAAISGLPPFNGFISEFMIYTCAFKYIGQINDPLILIIPAVAAIIGLALIGGLAVACFTKVFGIIFLGEPRSEHAVHIHNPGWMMRLPMVVLAFFCILIGLFPFFVAGKMNTLLLSITGRMPGNTATDLNIISGPLLYITLMISLFMILIIMLVLLRRWLLSRRVVEQLVTWDCGYAKPTARMQYTASSFVQPVTSFFKMFLNLRTVSEMPDGIFPKRGSFLTSAADIFQSKLFAPLISRFMGVVSLFKIIQQGRVQVYVLYVVIALITLLLIEALVGA